MPSPHSLEMHIRHCMLYEYRRGCTATAATKNICYIYPGALDVRKCQRWFTKFRSGNYDLSDEFRSGRPVILNNKLLKSVIEAKPKSTLKELSQILNSPRTTIQEHLKKIGKVNRNGVWISRSDLEESNSDQECSLKVSKKVKEPCVDSSVVKNATCTTTVQCQENTVLCKDETVHCKEETE